MGRLAEFGIYSLAGLSVGALTGSVVTNHAQNGHKVSVELCAEALGSVPIISEIIPTACEGFDIFSTLTQIAVDNELALAYILPTSEDFKEDAIDGAQRTDAGMIYIFSGVGLLAGAFPSVRKHLMNLKSELDEGYDPNQPTLADLQIARWEARDAARTAEDVLLAVA